MNAQTEMTEAQRQFDNKLLRLIQQHFPSIPLHGEEADKNWTRWLNFARDCAHLTKPDAGRGEARNFCPTCGKRLHKDSIHTCTPPSDVLAEPRNACLYDPDDVAFPKGFMPIDHPTPVQGEALPVVAYRKPKHGGGDDYKSAYYAIGTDFIHGAFALTDHAQATAEIARLTKERDDAQSMTRLIARANDSYGGIEAELKTVRAERDLAWAGNDSLRTQLSTALAESGEMAEAMKWLLDSSMVYLASNSSTSQDVSVWNRASDCLDVWEKGLGRHTTTQESAEPANKPKVGPTCNYPECTCPFDAPADPNWCARGYPKQAKGVING